MVGQFSGWGGRAPREIKNDPSYDEQVEAIGFPLDVLDRMLFGLFDTIATVPEEFDKVPGRDLYAADYIGRPRLRIWFTFDRRTVYLLGIERLD
jgi:hypothetical protein